MQAIDIYEELLGKVMLSEPAPETSLTDAIQLSRLYAAMGGLNRRIGRDDRASALEARRLDLWRRWDTRLPNNTFVRRQLDACQDRIVISRTPRPQKFFPVYAGRD